MDNAAPPSRWPITRIELAVILVIIAVAAAVTAPLLLRARRAATEAAAVQTLRDLFAAQTQFQGGGYLDLDADMVGEYGHVGHLAGTLPTNKVEAGLIKLMSGPLTAVPGRMVVKPCQGYGFTGWIPDLAPGDEDPAKRRPPLIEATPLPAQVVDYRRFTANDGERGYLIAAVPLATVAAGRVFVLADYRGAIVSPADATAWTGATAAGMQAGLADALSAPGDLTRPLKPHYQPLP